MLAWKRPEIWKNKMNETAQIAPIERSKWAFAAVLPTILFLLSIGLYAYTVRDVYADIFRDFGTELPVVTTYLLRLTGNPLLTMGIPSLVSVGLLYSSCTQHTTTTLCLTVGCLAIGFFAAIFLHISYTAPLVSLIQGLT